MGEFGTYLESWSTFYAAMVAGQTASFRNASVGCISAHARLLFGPYHQWTDCCGGALQDSGYHCPSSDIPYWRGRVQRLVAISFLSEIAPDHFSPLQIEIVAS